MQSEQNQVLGSATSSAIARSRALPVIVAGIAIGIFIMDTMTAAEVVVAMLYVGVVLLSARFLPRNAVVLVALGCMALALLTHFLTATDTSPATVANRLLSLAAIGISAFLALQSQSRERVLRERTGLLDLSHETIFVRDMNHVITYWNRGAEELYGWKKEEAVGKITYQLMHTIFPMPLEEIMAGLLRTGRWEGELIQTKKDGTRAVVASRWSLQLDALGNPVAILTTGYDITERRRAEDVHQVIETIPAMVWTAWPDGHADFFNRRWQEYTGLSLEQSLGWDWGDTVHPEDAEQYFGRWRESIATGQPIETEVRFRRAADGEYRWFVDSGVPLRDEHGNILKWYGVVIDIEDRKRAEAAARRSEKELRDLVETIPAMVWTALPDGHVEFINRRWQEFTGLTLDETLGWNWTVAPFHADDVERYMAKWNRSIATGKPFDAEMRIRRAADGEYRWLHESAVPLRDEDGTILKWYGTVTDIENRKRAEEALQKANAELAHVERVTTMGVLTSSIAHEVNQPLGAVVTNANAALRWLAVQPPNLDEARETVGRILRDGHRAGEIIGQVRALLRKTGTVTTSVKLNDIIEDAVALLDGEQRRHRILLRTELAEDLPSVTGDRVQLQQVILNLVMNGIEAMKEVMDRPREMHITSRLDASGAVFVAVKDVGAGLDPQCAARVFEAFYTTKAEGLGMGLAICRSIIEAHGGRLWAGANEPRGAVFQFTLPSSQDNTTLAEDGGTMPAGGIAQGRLTRFS